MNPGGEKDPGSTVDVAAARRFFSRGAALGGGADVLSPEIGRRMAERLDYVRLEPARILDAGSGTGTGAQQLARRYAAAQAVAVDSAHAVLARAGGHRSLLDRAVDRFISRRRIHPVCADFARLPFASGSFDLVWSNLALAWSGDALAVFREFHRVMRVGGLVMFSTYGPDTLRELRQAFAAVDAWPHTLRFTDMHDLGDMMVAAGFANPVMDMETITLTYADVEALAKDLRLSGQLNAASGRRRGLMGKRAYQAMRSAYDNLRVGGRLPATIEVVYGHAWRAESRTTAEGHSIIRTDFKQGLRSRS